VTEIIGEPYYRYNKWLLNVKFNSYGEDSYTVLMSSTKEEADNISIGHNFLS